MFVIDVEKWWNCGKVVELWKSGGIVEKWWNNII